MDCALAEKSVVHNNVAVQMKMRNLFFIVVIAILLNFVCDKFMFLLSYYVKPASILMA